MEMQLLLVLSVESLACHLVRETNILTYCVSQNCNSKKHYSVMVNFTLTLLYLSNFKCCAATKKLKNNKIIGDDEIKKQCLKYNLTVPL